MEPVTRGARGTARTDGWGCPPAGLRPGAELVVEVEALAAGGAGVCRWQGFVLFVPWTAPGDRVRVRVGEVRRRYGRAEPLEVLRPGPGRRPAPCPVFGACGGCQWQHLTEEAQLAAKERLVRDALERVGGLGEAVAPLEAARAGADASARPAGAAVAPALPAVSPWRYRCKAAFPCREGPAGPTLGFFAAGSHLLVPLPLGGAGAGAVPAPIPEIGRSPAGAGCAIQHERLDVVAEAVLTAVRELGLAPYDEAGHRGLVRHVVARVGAATGEVAVAVAANASSFPEEGALARRLAELVPGLVGVVLNENTARTNVILGPANRVLLGRPWVEERLGGLRLRVSVTSFFQVNPRQAERLFARAVELAGLTGREAVVDAYCGTGVLALLAARAAREVVGIEEVAAAVADARENARLNGSDNARFVAGRVEEELPRLAVKPDVVFVDPPRKGLAPEVVRTLRELGPRRLVYVSCDPATLARDLVRLVAPPGGFALRSVVPVDLFPQTAHVECLALLEG